MMRKMNRVAASMIISAALGAAVGAFAPVSVFAEEPTLMDGDSLEFLDDDEKEYDPLVFHWGTSDNARFGVARRVVSNILSENDNRIPREMEMDYYEEHLRELFSLYRHCLWYSGHEPQDAAKATQKAEQIMEELNSILTTEKNMPNPDLERINLVDFWVWKCNFEGALRKANRLERDQEGNLFVDKASAEKIVAIIEKRVMEDETVRRSIDEYVRTIAFYDEEIAAALRQRLVDALSKGAGAELPGAAVAVDNLERMPIVLLGKKVTVEGVGYDGTELDENVCKGKYVLLYANHPSMLRHFSGWGPANMNEELCEKCHEAGLAIISCSLDVAYYSDRYSEQIDYWKENLRGDDYTPDKILSVYETRNARDLEGVKRPELLEVLQDNACVGLGFTFVLIDPDGKVISVNAYGQRLEKLLLKAFPDVE